MATIAVEKQLEIDEIWKRYKADPDNQELRNLLVDVLPGVEAVIASEGVDPEIADQQRRRDIEAERRQNRSKPPAGDHGGKMPAAA